MENNHQKTTFDRVFESANDPFSKSKTKEEVIFNYLNQLNTLRKFAKQNYAIESSDFYDFLYNECRERTPPISNALLLLLLSSTSSSSNQNRQYSFREQQQYNTIKHAFHQLRQYTMSIAIVLILFILVNYHIEISKFFMRNIQSFIYPGMCIWRKFTLPIIRKFPQFTELYDETCLISNPFFRVTELDCTPCVNVTTVVDLTISNHFGYLGHFDSTIPHIIKQVNIYLFIYFHFLLLSEKIKRDYFWIFVKYRLKVNSRFHKSINFISDIVRFFAMTHSTFTRLISRLQISINCFM